MTFDVEALDNDDLDRVTLEIDRRGALPAWRQGISAAALMSKTFPPIRYIVAGMIAEGLTVLAGAPKARKSWMMLDVAHAAASGGQAFGSVACEHGEVLFLALEDNERRLQDRLRKMGVTTPPERLTFCTAWPTGDDAVTEIEAWAASAERPVMAVIDVLARVREFTGREASYEADYRCLVALQDLALRLGIAIVVIHHTRKMSADDPFDEVSGTRGLTGAADTVLVLRRDNTGGPTNRATLYGRGRDIPEIETALEFNDEDCRWKVMGEAWKVADTAEQQEILDLLANTAEPMKLAEIAAALGKKKDNVGHRLRKLVERGYVIQPAYGCYAPVKAVNSINLDGDDHAEIDRIDQIDRTPAHESGQGADIDLTFDRWLDECCDRKNASDLLSRLYHSWTAFARDIGEEPGSQRSLAHRLRKAGFQREENGRFTTYRGLFLKPNWRTTNG